MKFGISKIIDVRINRYINTDNSSQDDLEGLLQKAENDIRQHIRVNSCIKGKLITYMYRLNNK